MPAGHFSTAGEVPVINDERIQFFKGWFQETLPEYEWPGDYDRLIVVMDADLYEPTLYVLNFIADRITPGTLLFFDEFKDRNHELRAFSEFLRNHPMQLRVVGARKQLDFVMFECVR